MKTRTLALLCLPLVLACSDTAEPVRVATVEVVAATPTVVVGGTVQMAASVKDAAGNVLTDRVVAWTTNNPAVAVVNSSGLLLTAQVGTVIVTATVEGITGTATVNVIPPPVATVVVDPSTVPLQVGRTQQLNATTRDANNNVLTGRNVSWSSNNTSVATVSSTGLVTAVSAGTATVTATSEGRTGTASVTVTNAPVASVTITPNGATIGVGGVQQFSATLRDVSGNVLTGRTITWSSSNQGVATISAGGLALGITAGTSIITAVSEGQAASVALIVNPPPVATIDLTPTSATLNIGGTQQFTATTRDASGNIVTGRSVTWSSSNGAVATISGSGLVTAVAAGTTTITATSEGRTASATVTVNAANPTITLRNVTQGGTNVNFSNVSGTIVATYDVSLPAGHQASAIVVLLGEREACRTTVPTGTVGALEVQCTINTAATDAGGRLYPNGSQILSGRVISSTGAILAVIGASMVINNP
jgi:trimeric autotransporter adhesin